jgi:hypothetical protein
MRNIVKEHGVRSKKNRDPRSEVSRDQPEQTTEREALSGREIRLNGSKEQEQSKMANIKVQAQTSNIAGLTSDSAERRIRPKPCGGILTSG